VLIQRTLESMPNVAVHFSEPVAAPIPEGSPATAAAPSGTARASAPANKIEGRLEQQLGGRAEFERFTSQVLDLEDGMIARSHALHNLAQHIPIGEEPQLSAADRRTLRDMARSHVTVLSANLSSLQRLLTPVLTSLGGTAPRRNPSASTTWQASSDDLVRASHRVQVLVSVLLGVAPGQSTADLPSDVLNAVAEFRADLDRCQQLLAQEGGG